MGRRKGRQLQALARYQWKPAPCPLTATVLHWGPAFTGRPVPVPARRRQRNYDYRTG